MSMSDVFIALRETELGAAIDAMGEAMWQAENHRCMGRSRLVVWAEAGADVQAKWCQLAVAALGAVAGALPWRSMDSAPRDGTVIWACTRAHLREEEAGSLFSGGWRARWVAIMHGGDHGDGFDAGWTVAAPVGQAGLPHEWFEGWMPAAPIPFTQAPADHAPA